MKSDQVVSIPPTGELPQNRQLLLVPSWPAVWLVLLFVTAVPLQSLCQVSIQNPSAAVSVPAAPTAKERETDKQNMLTIYKALKSYEKDNRKLPDWLSDLVPKYIPDKNVLVSPFFLRTGQAQLYGNEDPHITTSYIYEFSAKPVPKVILNAFPGLSEGITMREWKTKQITEFGPVVPILRCFLHNPVLNVASDGEFFESSAYWETDAKTQELRKKRLTGGAKPEGNQKTP